MLGFIKQRISVFLQSRSLDDVILPVAVIKCYVAKTASKFGCSYSRHAQGVCRLVLSVSFSHKCGRFFEREEGKCDQWGGVRISVKDGVLPIQSRQRGVVFWVFLMY